MSECSFWKTGAATRIPVWMLILMSLGAVLLPALGSAQNVGNGIDYFAQAQSISSVEGSFINVTGVKSISSVNSRGTQAPNNGFSLQLNTNFFHSEQGGGTCPSYTNDCFGWVQFRYQTTGVGSGSLSIQYWLPWVSACPSQTVQGRTWALSSGSGCSITSPPISVPVLKVADLGNVRFYGGTSKGIDKATITVHGQSYSTTFPSPFPNLSAVWNTVEFNIFGLNSTLPVAQINNGASSPPASIAVRVKINNGTTKAPACTSSGKTAATYEGNSLTLNSPCCPHGGAEPSIVFVEGNARGQTTACAQLNSAAITPTVTPAAGSNDSIDR